MNERYKKIAEKAGFMLWADEDWNPGDVVDWSMKYDRELEKFAELIVRECIKAIDDSTPVYSEEDCGDAYCQGTLNGYQSALLDVKEHFGVE